MFHSGTAANYLDLLSIMDALMTERHLATVAVNNGGSGGYLEGEILTIDETGGVTQHGLSASVIVTAVSGGAVTAVSVLNGGAYSTDPTTTTANSTSGGSGSGCTVDITFADSGWIQDREQTVDTTETECIWHGEGDGTDSIYVGVKTYRDTLAATYFNWKIAGMTGYSSGEDFEGQPGYSGAEGGGIHSYTPIAGGATTAVDYWFWVSTYRVIGVFKVGSTYTNCYLGFLDRYSTEAQFPYPIYVSGCTSRANRIYSQSDEGEGGLTNPMADNTTGGSSTGPAAVRDLNGTWRSCQNGYWTGSSVFESKDVIVYPMGPLPSPSGKNFYASSHNHRFEDQFFRNDNTTTSSVLIPTQDSGGDKVPRFQATVLMFDPSLLLMGDLSGVYAVSSAGSGLVSQDTLTDDDGTVYVVFQNVNRTNSGHYIAIKRS